MLLLITMKSLMEIISNKSYTNKDLVDKLKRQIDKPMENDRQMRKISEIQEMILRQNVPQLAGNEIEKAKFANSLEYKKCLIKFYLKKDKNDLKQSKKDQIKEIECITHIENFLRPKAQKKSQMRISKLLDDFNIMQKEYMILKEKLQNTHLLNKISTEYNKVKGDNIQSLKNLVKRQGNKNMIIIRIKDIKQCIPKVQDVSVFNHWLFTSFQDLLQFNGIDKTLKLQSLTLFQKNNRQGNDINYYRLDIKPKSIAFKKDKKQSIDQFLLILESTFKLIREIQKQIKNKIAEVTNSNNTQKQIYDTINLEIEKEEKNFQKKVGQQIFPTIYLFDFEHRKKLFDIFEMQTAVDIDSMPSLLLSYRYSVESLGTEDKFTEIAKRISEKLISGGEKQFQQVCFFLEINTKIIKSKDGKKNLQGADFAFNLVKILINDCIDRIDYSKIEKLLRLQQSIRQFKNSISY